jgi:hypothetical protein
MLFASCTRPAAPQYTKYSQNDLEAHLHPGISRTDVERLFGQPVTEMELSETGYMLRFQMIDAPSGDLLGFDAFFTQEKLNRWKPWMKGDPNLPGQR